MATRKKKRKSDRPPAPSIGKQADGKAAPLWKSTRASRIVVGLVIAALIPIVKWIIDERARAHWEASKAVISFVKTESDSQLSKYDEHEAYFFFQNRAGGSAARDVHADDS